MSEVETVIAVAGTLGGVFLGYFLDERRENRRVGREVALRPLQDKEQALKDVYRAMVDFLMQASRIVENPETDRTPLRSLIYRIEASVTWGIIWFSEKHGGQVVDEIAGLLTLGKRLAKGGNLTKQEADTLFDYFITAGNGIIKDLGIDIAESQFRKITQNLAKGIGNEFEPSLLSRRKIRDESERLTQC